MGDFAMEDTVIKTDLLIVGAGPAGASLACFLASYGLTGIMIASAPGTANTPRAHITNMAALECLRDIDLERECLKSASSAYNMAHTRWCKTMAGEEYARIHSWGNDPKRKGDYDAASPCDHVDLPQTLLEPILTKRAIHDGWSVRFQTTFVKFTRPSPDVIVSEVKDELLGVTYKIQSKYLFGCDGARSQIVRELKIPLIREPGQGFALNILVKADLSRLMETRTGNLHWVFDSTKEYPDWGWMCVLRMVKPWHEWMFILLPAPGVNPSVENWQDRTDEYLAHVKVVIGDDSIDAEILDVSKWTINEIVAEYYSDGNIHCLGDAVHRHPPFNGLGSNTCVQDAFNLAWKIAYVTQGKASPNLLTSYNTERQPVGAAVIKRANQGLRDHMPWIATIGMSEPDVATRTAILAEFDDPGPKGRARREDFQRGIANTATEFHGLGIEMNQRYASGAVYLADESGPAPLPTGDKDTVTVHIITTYPGARLPHAWLNTRAPNQPPISTIDLAGHGRFTLITGPSGREAWKDAAAHVSQKTGVEIVSYSVGWRQDYEDVYGDWARRREIDEDGCVLIRPDRFVAWRAKSAVEDATAKLLKVMTAVLS